ncbi:VOC family protein [Brumicola nitratireducens]|uniref:Glyoxalase family protein n=1 Tax=Glaciecola nitratireducens (strain JCM 12485 / KCTC 12276 / FR1064) TaxID=1085623 RepID=G4QDZ9_GLANF|nr:VOC family protein [Glaciecola nitratireducens]AEP31273.1 glyoxalase family protein [Glaciecola nitratireducens FR1064]
MLTHIHHINFVVADLQKAIQYFQKLLSQQATIERLSERNVETARFKIGESLLILVQPITNEGAVASILKNKGEGIFLLSLATLSIDETLKDFELSYAEKRKGLEGWSVCDISPYEQFGAILQLTEMPQSSSK